MSNCPKCNAPLKPGAKFCTKCGTRIENPTAAPEATKAQASAGEPQKVRQQNLPADIQTATQRIYGNILQGQVARVITESELESYGSIRGIIVPEGTTAFVRAGGATIASISGGTYDFEEKPRGAVANAAEGVVSTLRRGWQTLVGLFRSGRKEAENAKDSEAAAQDHISGHHRKRCQKCFFYNIHLVLCWENLYFDALKHSSGSMPSSSTFPI